MAAALIALGPGPEALHHLRSVGSARSHRAVLALQHRDAGRLAAADTDIQGEAPEPARGRQPRPADLPRPAGRRHRPAEGVAGADRQGPGAPSGAEPRDRPRLQRPIRRDLPGAAGRLHGGARGAGHRRRQEDEQVDRQHHRGPGRAGRDPQAGHVDGDRHPADPADGSGPAARSATSASCTAISATTTSTSGMASEPPEPAASTPRSCWPSGSSPTTRRPGRPTSS